jgi:Tol biopolymer transport system component
VTLLDEAGVSYETEVAAGLQYPESPYWSERDSCLYFVEWTGERGHVHHTDPARGHWAQGRSYHVFRMNLDGSDLRQLTDGTWNDFDPCFMPSGRIAFTSERRGGYLRCGRVCPTFTV